jgi:hypothetical protein
MQHLALIRPEEMPQVIRIASELHEAEDQNSATQKQATIQAASEVGLTEAQLERAAEQWLQQRQVGELLAAKKKQNRLLTLLVGAILLVPGLVVLALVIPIVLQLWGSH